MTQVNLDNLAYLAHLRSRERVPRGIGDVDRVPPAVVLRDEMKWLTEYVAQCDDDMTTCDEAEVTARRQIADIRTSIADRRAQAVERIAEFESAARVLEMGVRMIDVGGNNVVFPDDAVPE